jgi:hypothetical protein
MLANFAVLQNAVVISKMQWFGFWEVHLPEVSPVFSATKRSTHICTAIAHA